LAEALNPLEVVNTYAHKKAPAPARAHPLTPQGDVTSSPADPKTPPHAARWLPQWPAHRSAVP
jgi:hypothetical protein